MKRLELKEIAQEMCLAALPDNEMDLEAISKPGASLTDLREYCFDQLAKASTDKEMSAAVALMEMLSDRIGTDDAQELQRLSDRAKITGRDKNTIRSA